MTKESFTSNKIQGTVFCDQPASRLALGGTMVRSRTAPYIVKALKGLFFGALM